MRHPIWIVDESPVEVRFTMRNVFIALFAALLFAVSIEAQSVTITGVKKVYVRPKPIVDFKRTFTVSRPVAKAATPAISKKITAAIDPVSVLGIDIQDELNDLQWLSEAGFKEVFNSQGILTVMLWMDGSGAYPSGVTQYVVVDTSSGLRLKPADLFADLPGLVAEVKKKQDAEVAEAIKEIKADPEWPADDDPKRLFEDVGLEPKDIENFAVDGSGIVFYYSYGFPHVIKALEPNGEFRLTWNEMRPFLKPQGLLARFVD